MRAPSWNRFDRFPTVPVKPVPAYCDPYDGPIPRGSGQTVPRLHPDAALPRDALGGGGAPGRGGVGSVDRRVRPVPGPGAAHIGGRREGGARGDPRVADGLVASFSATATEPVRGFAGPRACADAFGRTALAGFGSAVGDGGAAGPRRAGAGDVPGVRAGPPVRGAVLWRAVPGHVEAGNAAVVLDGDLREPGEEVDLSSQRRGAGLAPQCGLRCVRRTQGGLRCVRRTQGGLRCVRRNQGRLGALGTQASAASIVIVVPAKAFDTGHVFSAVSAYSANCSAVTPSIDARSVIAMPLISKPPPAAGPRVTSAVTSIESAVSFWASSTPDRFIARHDECAAAMSSSGLVWPSGLPARVGNETENVPALDESSVTSPFPFCSPPTQWVVASRLGIRASK